MMRDAIFDSIDQNNDIDKIRSTVKTIFYMILEEDKWLENFFLHPLGFYYCRLHHDDYNQFRLHIWEPGYPIKEDLYIHDHFYDLCSWVLCGKIEDYTYSVEPSENISEYALFTSSYLADKNLRTLTKTDQHMNVKLVSTRIIESGEKYFIPRETFHSNKILFGSSTITATFVYTFNHKKNNAPNVIGSAHNEVYRESDPVKAAPEKVKELIQAVISNSKFIK